MYFEVEQATGLMLKLMQKREPLRSDLWAYLHHGDGASDGLVLQHPLLHVVGVKMEGAAWINHLVHAAEATAKKALAEQRWVDHILLHNSPYRVAAFAKVAKTLPDAVFWKCLGEMYINTATIWQRKRQILRLFAAARPHRNQMMSAYERRYLARLPSRLTLFQGSKSKRIQSWSWTLDERKALGLAKRQERLGARTPKVATGKANKSDVIAYFSRRKEREILIDPSKVKIMRIETLPKSGRH